MGKNLIKTPLYDYHKNAGANMADFGGFEMPLWYESGVKNEHLAVLNSVGIFDTSHMACITLNGTHAAKLLDLCFTRNVTALPSYRCIYGAFLNTSGHCIDDAIVYKFSHTCFMICVNAGMGATIAGHLASNNTDPDVEIKNLSPKIAKMDIQGINSLKVLSKLIQTPLNVFQQMPYFSFKGALNDSISDGPDVKLLDGTRILLSRTGYTGEFGFEIFLPSSAITAFWNDTLEAGRQFSILACGLGARDSLRTGACLPLSQQDIGNWKFTNHPWDFALPYSDDKKSFTKPFIGREALIPDDWDTFTYPFVGDSLRKVSRGKNTEVINKKGEVIGKVLTCVTDMGITLHQGRIISIGGTTHPRNIKIKGLSCGFVMVSHEMSQGDRLILKEGNRKIPVTIVRDIRPDRTAKKKIESFM